MARTARERIHGDPLSAELYTGLIQEVGEIGEYELEEKLTSIHVVHRRAFLGIHPRKGALLVNIVLDHPIDSARLHRTEQVSAARWHHEILLHSTAELDTEFVGWITNAYALTTRP